MFHNYSGFTHESLWRSIAMLVYQRVDAGRAEKVVEKQTPPVWMGLDELETLSQPSALYSFMEFTISIMFYPKRRKIVI